MAKRRKKKKRPGPLRSPEPAPSAEPQPAAGDTRSSRPPRRPASKRPQTAEERRAVAAGWAHPPLAASVARGLRVVGTDPMLLISSFVAALALWLVFSLYGTAPSAGAMVLMTSLPPVHSLLIDVGAVLTAGADNPVITLAFLVGLLLFRAALLSFWVAAILDRLDTWPEFQGTGRAIQGDDGGGQGDLARVVRSAMRSFVPMVGIQAGYYVLALATAFVAVAFAIGQLALIGGLIGGLYFFVFAPMAAIGERVGPRAAAVLSIRAARLPGPRHLAATAAFVALALVVSLFAPTSRVFEASPSITTWLFVLFVTFINMATLATFAYRWLVVRDATVEAANQAAKEGKRPRPMGLLRR
jgi:hypothetical protein